MEALRKTRGGYRGVFTRKHTDLAVLLAFPGYDYAAAKLKLESLEQTMEKIQSTDEKILDMMSKDNTVTDEQMEKEIEDMSTFSDRFIDIKAQVNALDGHQSGTGIRASLSSGQTGSKDVIKLPKLKPKSFSGDLKDWLSWWSHFKKIHEDTSFSLSTKFEYLSQAMVEGSHAKVLVDSYPQSDDNYPKVITALQDRFGNKEVLAQVYIRELLNLVFQNVQSKEKIPLGQLYDSIEGKVRSLESLGATCNNCGNIMLFPLVESCLPEELLRTWQRQPKLATDTRSDMRRLLDFMNNEVLNEQKINLARDAFGNGTPDPKKNSKKKQEPGREEKPELLPTAAALHRNSESSNCLFCAKSHESKDCTFVNRMSLDEKRQKIKDARACFKCLRTGHSVKFCRVKYLSCAICSKQHYVFLCPELVNKNKSSSENKSKKEEAKEEEEQSTNGNVMNNQVSTETVLLQTLMIKMLSPNGKSKLVRAMYDSGAQRSCVLRKTAEELELKNTGSETIVHTLFGGQQTRAEMHNKYRVTIEGLDGEFRCTFEILDEKKITGRVPRIPKGAWLNGLNAKIVPLTDVGPGCPEIELLIGADFYGRLLTGNVNQITERLTAWETKLGWVLTGKVPVSQLTNESVSNTVIMNSVLDTRLCELWDLETIGIEDPVESPTKEEKADAAKKFFRETVHKDQDGRYEIMLPWSMQKTELSDNKTVAVSRLSSAMKKLEKQNLVDEYGRIFEEWLTEGIIEKVPAAEISYPCHYLPHRPVVKTESLTFKIRPVFDASCKSKAGLSLNDCLEKGPNLLELIPSILLRFRENEIGAIADIRKAFLQIGIQEEDRNYLRFLWRNENGDMVEYRHKRVVFGVNCSPYLLLAVIELHLEKYGSDSELARKLWHSMYVDNCVVSVKSLQELDNFKKYAVEAFAAAKMDLRLWENTGEHYDSLTKHCGLLGLRWDKEEDKLFIKIENWDVPVMITKRVVLSHTQSVFDPLGFASPVMLVPKLILQAAWNAKRTWDEPLSEEDASEFRTWMNEIQCLNMMKIPRRFCHASRSESSWSLHVFSDASIKSYSGVVFLRCETSEEVSVQMLFSKSRVAPAKKCTIPRLELMGCLIACRMTKVVREALQLEDTPTHYWSDSKVALAWIKRRENWGVFVSNRVKEIRIHSAPDEWQHVPGHLNPADLPSRGCSPSQLLGKGWWEGPTWLRGSRETWPNQEVIVDEDEVNKERRKAVIISSSRITETTTALFTRYSSYKKIIRIVAWIMRWRNKKTGDFSREELNHAERKLLMMIQSEESQDEFRFKHAKTIRDDNGLIRVETKILRRNDLELFICPILLPKDHMIVEIIVREFHLKNNHAGVQTLMALLREKFWIPSGRQVIKKIVTRCVRCRRFSAKRMEAASSTLPLDRVENAAVFQVIGVDLAGPLFLRDETKVWIAIFTCALYRAVHLELVSSMSAECFLQAFRRFVSRRGRPSVVYSDNGRNFVGCYNLMSSVDWEKIKLCSEVEQIDWKFIPPRSPWWGGFWERMIGTVKKLLVRILGHAVVDFEELNTMLCEVESTVNDRPLTYVSEDVNDLAPLTPSRFLKDIRSSQTPDIDAIDAAGLKGRFKHRQRIRDAFRSRFRSEYLSQLVQRAKNKPKRSLEVGEVVLIGEDDKKRILWPMGRIEKLFPGADGEVRVVEVKTPTGTMKRAVQRIFPLEVRSELELVGERNNEEESDGENSCKSKEKVVTRAGRTVKKPSRLGI